MSAETATDTTAEDAPPVADDVRLNLATPSGRGLPLNLVGFILRALGTAYPNTKIDQGSGAAFGGGSVMSLLIPMADISAATEADDEDYDSTDFDTEGGDMHALPTDAELAEYAASTKSSEAMTAFTNGIRKGGISVLPPPWLTTLLLEAGRDLNDLAVDLADNYLEMGIVDQANNTEYRWIVCRPGRPTPHGLRLEAEARVALLEAQLRDAGIEPIAAVADTA